MQRTRDLTRKLIACLIVFMLMFTNCSTLCSALVAYAADNAKDQISFSAKFIVVENTEKVDEIENGEQIQSEQAEIEEEGEETESENLETTEETTENEIVENETAENENVEETAEENPEQKDETETVEVVKEDNHEEQVLENGLAIEITVGIQNSGYLKNAKIEIKDLVNQVFRLKDDISYGEYIQSIDENKIKLKQIDSEKEVKIYIPIELKSEEYVNIAKLQEGTELQLTTTYVDSEGQEEILTKSVRAVIDMKNDMDLVVNGDIEKFIPYVKEGVNEALVQMKIVVGTDSKNELPVKDTTIDVVIPKIDGAEIKDVTVSAISTGFTNGLQNGEVIFTVENWKVQDTLVTISVNNVEKDGMYRMNNGNDEYIISYKYSNISDISKEILHSTVNVSSNVFTSEGNKQISNVLEKEYDLSQANSNIITYDLTRKTESLSKGYLYANANSVGEAEYCVEYDNTLDVNISRVDLVKTIEIRELSEYFVDEYGENFDAGTSTYYETIKVNRSSLMTIIGDTGNLELLTEDGKSLIVVDKDVQDDGDGYITISFGENRIGKILIRINNPVSDGILTVTAMKAIEKVDFEKMKIKEIAGIVSEYVAGAELIENIITEIGSKVVYTEFENTITDATLGLNRTNLSTLVRNEDVEIELALHNATSVSDMYTNPVFEIVFPNQIENVDIKDINLLYGNDELAISNVETFINDTDCVVLRVSLKGRQTKYVASESDKGTTIIIDTDIDVNMYTASKNTTLKMNYYNEDATNYGLSSEWNMIAEPSAYMMLVKSGIYDTELNIVAPDGLVNAQMISNYRDDATIMSVNQGRKEDSIATFTDARKAEMKMLVINNTAKDMTDVKILGRTIFSGNKLITENQVLGTNMTAPMTSRISLENDNNGTTIYYSENGEATDDLKLEENGWTTEPKDLSLVRSYLIVLDDTLRDGTILTYTYNFEIPENLSNNLDLAGTFATYYNENGSVKVVEADKVILTTGDAPVLEVETVSDVNGLNAVEGQRVKYTVKVTNKGRTTSENTVVTSIVPDGTTYVNENGDLDPKTKELTLELGNIPAGRTAEATYEVQINTTSGSSTEIKPDNKVEADGLEEGIYTTTKDVTFVQQAKASVSLYTEKANYTILPGREMTYDIGVRNQSGKTLENAVITQYIPEGFEFVDAYIEEFEEDGIVARRGDAGSYDAQDRTVTWVMSKMGAFKGFKLIVKTNSINDVERKLTMTAKLNADNLDTEYVSNAVSIVLAMPKIEASYSSTVPNQYVLEGDVIEYELSISNTGKADAKNLVVSNELPSGLTVLSAKCIKENGTEIKALAIQNVNIKFNLPQGENAKIVLKCLASNISNNLQEELFNNNWKISGDNVPEQKTVTLQNIVQQNEKLNNMEVKSSQEISVNNKNVNQNNKTTVNATNTKTNVVSKNEDVRTYRITGKAFYDLNRNGRNDDGRKIQNIVVKLCNATTQSVEALTVTNAGGEYVFDNVEKGTYYIKFEYDNSRYEVTDYKKEGVAFNENSDAIVSNYKAVTDKITISDSSVSDIDIGLYRAGIFDLSLDANIDKVTVQNEEETKTYNVENSKLGKIDVDPKYVDSTKVFIEYTISVTNNGEISGYAKSIVDYIPNELQLDTTLNKNWYMGTNGNAYTRELENVLIQPGETKEIKLILTKQMTEESTGLINNNFEIATSYNERAIADIDSVEGNKAYGEDDMSNADMIIGIKTGGGMISVMIISTTLLTLLIALYMIKLHIDKKNKEVIV